MAEPIEPRLCRAAWGALALFAAAGGCGDSSAEGGAGGSARGGEGGAGGAIAPGYDLTIEGDRPVIVKVPPGYDASVPAPLVVLLHGYGASGGLEDVYLEMSGAAAERGVIFAAPNGTPDMLGRNFWNATDACCNFDMIDVDDSSYLAGLVDAIAAQLAVDPKRVFFAGHSNGGFMAHRLACEHADIIAGIAVLSAALSADLAACAPTAPVSVLHLHGTADDTILYDGGVLAQSGNAYPGVSETLGRWVELDGCGPAPAMEPPLDLDAGLAGSETEVSVWSGCDAGSEVEHWKIVGGSHVPAFNDAIGGRMIDWLLAHPKP